MARLPLVDGQRGSTQQLGHLFLCDTKCRAFVDQHLSIEAQRGFRDVRDFNLCAGHFAITLDPGEKFCVVASTEAHASLDAGAAYRARRAYERGLIETAEIEAGGHREDVEQLVLAADPNHVVALNNLAYLLAEHTKNFEEALAYATKAAELAPELT